MTPAAVLAQLHAEVEARFPGERATLGAFVADLARVLGDPGAGDASALVCRFEDYLEALVVRELRR